MTQPKSPLTLSKLTNSDSRFDVRPESPPKNDSSMVSDLALDVEAGQGFKIAKGSDISPKHLIKSGFVMFGFKFYPSNFEDVKAHFSDDFIVFDELTGNELVFGFCHFPF